MQGCATNATTPDLIDANGAVLKTSQEKGSALLQCFVQQSNENNLDERKAVWKVQAQNLDRSRLDFKELKFTEALSGLRKDTAPGPDKLKYSDIKNLPVDDKSELFTLYEESFAREQVPDDRSRSYLKPISKPCKDHRKLNGYRILTIQSTSGKLMKWIVPRKLVPRNVRPPNQGGYKSRKTAWENASRFSYDVYERPQRKEQTLAIAVDLEDAYNNSNC